MHCCERCFTNHKNSNSLPDNEVIKFHLNVNFDRSYYKALLYIKIGIYDHVSPWRALFLGCITCKSYNPMEYVFIQLLWNVSLSRYLKLSLTCSGKLRNASMHGSTRSAHSYLQALYDCVTSKLAIVKDIYFLTHKYVSCNYQPDTVSDKISVHVISVMLGHYAILFLT